MQKYRWLYLLTVLTLLLSAFGPVAAAPASRAATAPALTQVNVAGSFESEIGGADWTNNDPATNLLDANTDGIWKFSAAIPVAGSYEYKIIEDGDWGKAYPTGNVPFTVAAAQEVRWYYDPADHYVADNVNKVIAAAVGNFPSKIGGADWAPDNLKTLLKGPDAAGKYEYTAKGVPAGSYEYKIALNEGWAEAYPGGNKAFTVPAGGGDVKFTFDPATKAVSEEVIPPSGGLITIDGTKDAAYGAPVATDPQGDMSEANLDLKGLFVVDDANNFYIGFDAFATTWGMTYGVYIDTDQTAGSGASSDPWGRAVNADPAGKYKPEYALYVWHKDDGTLENAQLTHWDGAAWQFPTLISVGGAQGFSATTHFLEYAIPKAALGNPAHIAIEVFTTGGGGHAQDSVPPDANVNFAAPDWGGATTTLSNFVVYPKVELLVTFPGSYPAAAGLGNDWAPDNLNTKGTDTNGDQVFILDTATIPAGTYEFKAAVGGGWAENYGADGKPGGDNLKFDAPGGAAHVRFYYDRRDNWVANNQVGKIVTLVGSLGEAFGGANWAPDNLATWMKDTTHDGWYVITGTLPAGVYEYKIAVGEGWAENYGKDGAPGGGNIALTVPKDGTSVTFRFNYASKQIRDSINNPAQPGPDGDIWWDGLGHDSRDLLYRTPFGAVTKGADVRLRFRTYANDATGVGVRVVDLLGGGASTTQMTKVATVPDQPFGYDFYEVTLKAPDKLTVLAYTFGVTDGDKVVYYADDAAADGGWGLPYSDAANAPGYNIYVYDKSYTTPEWAKNAVIYQIFPDRFRNGDKANDPTASKWFYPAERGHAWPVAPWNTIVPDPEPNDPSNPWYSTYSSTFYGGDLKGVLDKLDYLQSFGVNTIYFNPIFLSPSNHRYDGSDYRTIDPALGDLALFKQLADALHGRGMKLILDMVPNHVSSDSIYFDRFGRYPEVGACESVDSPYRSWFYFTPANPAGTGVCAGDTNYQGWFGIATLPKVNTTDNAAVREFWMRNADATAKFWLNNGADGYRVDVANEIAPSFFEEWRPILKATKPDVVTYSETWNESDVRPMVLGDKFDSTMNYRYATALLSFLRDTRFSDGDGNIALDPLKPSQFINALRAMQEDYPEAAWSVAMNLLDSHDTNRAVNKLDHDGISGTGANRTPVNGFTDGKNRLKTVALLQYTLPGAPTIYYGDEVGLAGFGSDVNRDDPYNRQPYPWADEPGYSDLPAWRQADASLLAHYQKMGQIRTQYSFLRTGSFDTLLADDDQMTLAYQRVDATGVGVVVVNRAKTSQTVIVKVRPYLPDGLTFTDALNGGAYTVTDGSLSIPLNGLWGAVLIHAGAVVAPDAPADLQATESDDAVKLTWNAVAGATGYKVFRSYLSGGGYTMIVGVVGAGLTYTDLNVKNGQSYYYIVRAERDGMESKNSNEVMAIPHHNIDGLLLQWPPSITHTIKAGQASETIYARVRVKYVTAKSGATDGLWMQIGYGPAGTLPSAWQTWQEMAYSKDYPASDDKLKEWEEWMGKLMPDAVGQYTYLVRVSPTGGRDWVYGGFRAGTAWGGILNVVPSTDTTPPAAPANLKVKGTTPASITLAWDANTDADLWGYQLYRQPSVVGGLWAKIAAIPAGTTQYADREVNTGWSYNYYLLAVDTSYNRSPQSNQVTGKAEARMVRITFNVTVPAATPSGDVVYLPGDQPDLGPWTPNKWAMTQVDTTHWTTTLQLLDGTLLQYKYARGSWDVVEWWTEIHDTLNRSLSVNYGADGTQIVNDTVPNWRDPLVDSTTPANGATGVAKAAVLSAIFTRGIKPEDLDAARFSLKTGDVVVAGAAAFDAATNTATFTPSAALAPGVYTWTVGPGIRGDADSPMQNAYVVTFTTAP